MLDDESPMPRNRLAMPPLGPLGITELQAYIVELRAEITRAEMEITRKQNHRDAADGMFRQP